MASVVIIKTKGAVEFFVQTSVGGNREVKYEWSAKNDFTCKVPKTLEYYDPYKQQTVVTQKNYPKFLLEAYPTILEFVGEEEIPDFVKQEEAPSENPEVLKAQIEEEKKLRLELEQRIKQAEKPKKRSAKDKGDEA